MFYLGVGWVEEVAIMHSDKTEFGWGKKKKKQLNFKQFYRCFFEYKMSDFFLKF